MEKSNKSSPLPKKNISLSYSNSSSDETDSYGESISEDYEWSDKEINEKFLQFPLKKWYYIISDLIYTINVKKQNYVINEGGLYKNSVNKILKEDVFKGEKFEEENKNILIISGKKERKEFFKNEFSKFLKNKNKNNWILPDFLVFNIERKKFLNIIKERDYMMYLKGKNIPDNIEKVNILGEIKISKTKSNKTSNQRSKYVSFIQNYSNEYFILMNVFDVSYEDFFNKKKSLYSEITEINCYIPKTYFQNCYKKYNNILEIGKCQPIKWEFSEEEVVKENINMIQKILIENKKKLENLKNNKLLQLEINFLNEQKNNFQNKKNRFNFKTKNLEIKETNFLFLNSKLEKIRKKINEIEIKNDSNNLVNLKNEEKDLNNQIEKLDKDIKKEEEELKIESEIIDKKEKELFEKEKELDLKNDELKKEIENLENEINMSENEIKELEKKLKELKEN